jgi:phage gp29-like protein
MTTPDTTPARLNRKPSDIYGAPGVPTNKITVVNARFELPSIGSYMDVDQVYSIFAAAEAGVTLHLMLLYRDIILSDSHIQGELNKRKLAVLGDELNIRPFEKTNAADISAAAVVKGHIGGIKDWVRVCSHLLDATVYPVAVVEKVFAAAPGGYVISELVPVPHRLLDFRMGDLRIFDVDERGMPQSTSHEADPNRYIIHRGHLLSAPDKFGGPMRALVFWWLLMAMGKSWWARFLDKYGSAFLLGKYNTGDDESRSTMERAFALASRIGGIVVSKECDVELKEASQASGDNYEKFIAVCQREMSKLILGQTLSAEARPTGLGSGQANLAGEVRDDIRLFDSMMLGSTIRDQLAGQLLAINGTPGNAPVVSWGSVSSEAMKALADLMRSLNDAGLEVADDAMDKITSLVGFNVQRTARPAAVPATLRTLSASMNHLHGADPIARRHSADLSRAMRGTAAEIGRLVALSTSAEDLEARMQAHFSDLAPFQMTMLLDAALTDYARASTRA